MPFLEQGYEVLSTQKIDVTTSAGSGTNLYCTVHLHNAGLKTVYISGSSDVNTNDWELAAGEKIGPIYFQTLYCITAADTSTVKALRLKGV